MKWFDVKQLSGVQKWKTSGWPSLAKQKWVFNKMLEMIVINSCDHISWQNNQDWKSYRHRRCGAAEWVIWGWGVWWRGPRTHRDTPQTQTCRSRLLALVPCRGRNILHIKTGAKDKKTTLKRPWEVIFWNPTWTHYFLSKLDYFWLFYTLHFLKLGTHIAADVRLHTQKKR